MLRTSISIYQYLTSVEAILKRICFVLDVLNITIAHHKGFRHVHHGLLGKIMSHLGDESSPPKKRSPLFAVPWPVLRLRCLRWKVYQAAPEEKGPAHPQSSSQRGILLQVGRNIFEGNAKLTYRTLQGLGTSAHTTHFHVAWMIDGKLDS